MRLGDPRFMKSAKRPRRGRPRKRQDPSRLLGASEPPKASDTERSLTFGAQSFDDLLYWEPRNTPEQMLLLAVLEDALHCLRLGHEPLASQAKYWFRGADAPPGFSFFELCQHLRFREPPDRLAEHLIRLCTETTTLIPQLRRRPHRRLRRQLWQEYSDVEFERDV